MLRRFARDGGIYTVTGLLTRALSFILLPIYTRLLGPADFGVLDLLVLAAGLVNILVTLEIGQAVARFMPDAVDDAERRTFAAVGLRHTILAYLLFCAAGAAMAGPIAREVFDGQITPGLFRLALAWMAASGLFALFQNQLRFELRTTRYAVVSTTYAAVTVATTVLLVVGMQAGLSGAILGQLVGATSGAALGAWFTRRSFAARFSAAQFRSMLRFSLPLLPGSLSVFASIYTDRIAVKQLLSLEELGVFGVAYRFASIATLLLVGVQGALTPLLYAHHREPGTPAALARLFRWFVAAALVGCVALAVLAPELLAVVTTARFAGARAPLAILTPALLLSGMYVFAPGLALAKRTAAMAALPVGAAVVNLALNFALIPRLGIAGAAAATLVSAALFFGLYMAASQRLYPVPHHWPGLAAATLLAAAIGAAAPLLATGTWEGIFLKLLVVGAFAAALPVLRLVRLEELRRLWRAAPALRGARAAAPALGTEEP